MLYVLALVLVPSAVFAQASLTGVVRDTSGAVLPGVAIVVTNEETGVFRDVVTGPAGTYFASQLVPGRYRISAKLQGFHATERGGLILQVGKTLTINMTLAVGTIRGVESRGMLVSEFELQISDDHEGIIELPDVKKRWQTLGAEPMPMSPEQFDKYVAEQSELVAKLVKTANIQLK